jgi:hypothetical protein
MLKKKLPAEIFSKIIILMDRKYRQAAPRPGNGQNISPERK